MTEKAAKPRIVILGGGIAGIRAARKLANEAVDVLIIDHNNYQVFQPLLYQVATSMLFEPKKFGVEPSAMMR